MSNKKDLKAYVRYGGNGMIVPSSIILSRVKPKVGNWKETPAYLCNGISMYVCNAGTDAVNGRYVYAGLKNGKAYYTKGIYRISWGEYPGFLDWEITDGTDWFYYNGENIATPNLGSGGWHTDDGDDPSPTVGLCSCSEIVIPSYPLYICIAGLVANSELNGTYAYIGQTGGKPHYQKDGNRDVYWDGTQWLIGGIIYSTEDVANPTLVVTWVGTDGPMTVIDGSCVFPSDCHIVTLTCTQEGSTATFGVYYCYEEPSVLKVAYGSPQDVCCYDYPVLLDGQGTMLLGDNCTTTSTTTTETPTTTTTTTEAPTTTTTTTVL
jgi:hypothetical protein